MNLSKWWGNPYDPSYSADGTAVLALLDPKGYSYLIGGDLLAAMTAAIQAQFDPLDSVYVKLGTLTEPGFATVKSGQYLLVFIDGARVGSLIERIKTEWESADPFSDVTGGSRLAFNALNAMMPFNAAAFVDGVTQVRIFGYSWGGSIAATANLMFRHWKNGIQVRSSTYGAPKGAGPGLANRLIGFGHVWYQLSGDLVPALPPAPEDAPALVKLWYGLGRVYQRFTYWTHPGSGYYVGPGTSLTTLDKPAITAQLIANYVVDHWYGNTDEQDAFHSIHSYAFAFLNMVLAQAPPPPPPPPDTKQRRTRLSPAQIAQVDAQGEALIFADLSSPNSVIRDYQVTPIEPGTPDNYRATKKGGLWYVTRQGKVVTVGPAKRVAKLKARRLNHAMRK